MLALQTARTVRALVCLLACLIAVCGLSVAAAGRAHADGSPEKVAVGVFVNDIEDITLASNSYNADIYLWLRWRNPEIDPSASIEAVNSYGGDGVTLARLFDKPQDLPDGNKYMVFRGQGTFGTKMNLQRYPFDVQKLQLEFEDSAYDAGRIEYVADPDPAYPPITINQDVDIPGYVISAPELVVTPHVYPTNFGDTSSKSAATYSRVTVTLPVKRQVLALAVKIMMPIVIVILLTSLIYVLPARLEEARAGIAVTAMLTLMALQWTVTSSLPNVSYLMMIDVIYIVSMVYILIAMAYSAIGSRRSLHEREQESTLRLDRRVGLASLAAYAALLVATVLLYLR